MKIAKALILIGFTAMLIIATIDLAMQPKATNSEPTRIEAPQAITEYQHIRVDKAKTRIIEAEIKAEQYNAPVYEIMWGLPINTKTQMVIEQMCIDRDIDAAVVVAMIWHESRYDEKAIGDNGKSFGLMQIQPRWHEQRIKRLGVTDLLDGSQNVIVGIDYLDELLDRYNGDYGAALTAYNQGHYYGTVSRYAINILQEAKTLCTQ